MKLEGLSILGADRGATGGKVFRGVNPATGESLPTDYHSANEAEVDRAARMAEAAFDKFSATSGHDRAEFLRRIAANAARDHLRRMAVRREDELDEALHLEGGDDPHDRAERMAEVRLMLAALADEDGEVVELLTARANGVSVETLAVEMKISPDALKMRVMRARKRLRARLDEMRRGVAP